MGDTKAIPVTLAQAALQHDVTVGYIKKLLAKMEDAPVVIGKTKYRGKPDDLYDQEAISAAIDSSLDSREGLHKSMDTAQSRMTYGMARCEFSRKAQELYRIMARVHR